MGGELMPPSFVPLFTGRAPVSKPLITNLHEFKEKVEAKARTSSYGTPNSSSAFNDAALLMEGKAFFKSRKFA
jgi:hypothetical protein